MPLSVVGRVCRLLAGLSMVVLATSGHGAATQTVSGPELRAAFLFNFAKFAEWPESFLPREAPIVLCVAADSKVANALADLTAGRNAGGHDLVVRRVELDGPVSSCHLLYAAGLDQTRSLRLLSALQGRPVFSVSDFGSFAQLGGIAHLFVDGDRMRFAINPDAAMRSQLTLSSRLLSVAVIVKDQPNVVRP